MNEKDIYNLQCIDMNHEGLGVVKKDGFPIFVPNLIVGEQAKIKLTKVNKSFALGEVVQIIEESKLRVRPRCKHFFKCGGCDLMHLDYKSQLDFKLSMANATFQRIGHLDFKIKNIIGMDKNINDNEIQPYYYRNKVQIPFGMRGNKTVCGFYKKKTHDIIDLDECFIQPILSTEIGRLVKNIMNELGLTAYDEQAKKGCIRHTVIRKTVKNEYMIVFVIYDDCKSNIELINELATKITNKYKEIKSVIINVNKKVNNVILGDYSKTIYGTDVLIENILGLNFKLSHKAFFQINHTQTEKLYSKALEFANITNNDVVLDCYCGVGTISLLAATKAKKVYGIEVVKEAIDDAIENAKLNKITNAEFIVGKAEEEILKFKDKLIDIMIVDPPRKGLDIDVINTIIQKKIEKIVYVSCDIATLARDLQLLQSDYEIKEVTLVDMFPQTADVETVAMLVRK